jgi:hypothetical protein
VNSGLSVWDPFSILDLPAIYEAQAVYFDGVLYTILFTSLGLYFFKRWFTGEIPRWVPALFGIIMGSLLAWLLTLGSWSLSKLPPNSLSLALLLCGILLAYALTQFDMPWMLAIPAAVFFVYSSVRATNPSLMAAISILCLFVHQAVAGLFVFMACELAVMLWSSRVNRRFNTTNRSERGRMQDHRQIALGSAEKLLLSTLRIIITESMRIRQLLKAIKRELVKSNPNWQLIAQYTFYAAHQSDQIDQRIKDLATIDFSKNPDVQPISPKIEHFAALRRSFHQLLVELEGACSNHDKVTALQLLGNAIQLEKNQCAAVDQLLSFEKQLLIRLQANLAPD